MNTLEYLTYHRLENSHWGKRILAAEANGGFDESDTYDSSQWLSCACGRLDDHIERDRDGSPRDIMLESLGVDFSCIINDDDYDDEEFSQYSVAAEILVAIEQRSAELM